MLEERSFRLATEEETEPTKDSDVFYNTKMLENRDLSERCFETFASELDGEIRTCDALSGCGVRGFRYAEFSDELVLNDANPEAVEAIEEGLEINGLEGEVRNKDANVLLSQERNSLQIVEIDPFGPFTTYLDSAARSCSHTSMAGLTATDVAVPSGSYTKTCLRRYGAKPLRNSFKQETALRIYIAEAFRGFARHDKAFDPKLCFQHRHYCRLMGRVTESKSRCNRSLEHIGHLTFCPECLWRELERAESCGNCGYSGLKVAGPLWTGKIADSRFTAEMLDSFPEEWESSRELLELVDSEAELVKPFYELHALSSSVGVSSPPLERTLENIEETGYPASKTHFSPTGIRTTMPVDQLRELVEEVSGG